MFAVYRSRISTDEPRWDNGGIVWYLVRADDGSDVWQRRRGAHEEIRCVSVLFWCADLSLIHAVKLNVYVSFVLMSLCGLYWQVQSRNTSQKLPGRITDIPSTIRNCGFFLSSGSLTGIKFSLVLLIAQCVYLYSNLLMKSAGCYMVSKHLQHSATVTSSGYCDTTLCRIPRS